MSKIVVGNAEGAQGVRLSLEKRLEYNLDPESMRDNYFVEMYGVDKLGCDLGSRLFLGIIDQLAWAKRFTKKGSTVIVEKPEYGLSHAQKEVVLLSILQLVHMGHDVVIETNDADFVLLLRLLDVTRKDYDGVKSLMYLLGVKRHERIWERIFTEILRNCQVNVAYNPIENTNKEAVS
jgi:hypothetical protein